MTYPSLKYQRFTIFKNNVVFVHINPQINLKRNKSKKDILFKLDQNGGSLEITFTITASLLHGVLQCASSKHYYEEIQSFKNALLLYVNFSRNPASGTSNRFSLIIKILINF